MLLALLFLKLGAFFLGCYAYVSESGIFFIFIFYKEDSVWKRSCTRVSCKPGTAGTCFGWETKRADQLTMLLRLLLEKANGLARIPELLLLVTSLHQDKASEKPDD